MARPLSASELRERLLAVCDEMIRSNDLLCQADRDLGDGDHGITMERAFASAREALSAASPSVAGDFGIIGAKLLAAGGTTGAVFGTLFLTLGRNLKAETLDGDGLAMALDAAIAAVEKRGKAKAGDKTMLDALIPALAAIRANSDGDMGEVLTEAAGAASAGAEATRDMVAQMGRARTMGERSIGFIDPGALSVSIIFRNLAKGSAQ
jgi:dihydroxyacetone kinase-like protein